MITHDVTLYRYAAPLIGIPHWLKKQIPTSRISAFQRNSTADLAPPHSKLIASSLRMNRRMNKTEQPITSPISPPFAQQEQQFNQLIKKSGTILYRVSSVFPFDFFPDTIIIDENKIEIVERTFFLFEKVCPILISDIKTVTVSCGPLFATLYIELIGLQENPGPIPYLWRWEALRASRIILGLMTCFQEGLDLSQLKTDHVADRLVTLGHARMR
ncbi:hypothetical protein HY468_00145 [Candidatus Roizmanbacteria bacterium]|nr:hypothetical protein [Candidatus Roizmanbacteria bacterium]